MRSVVIAVIGGVAEAVYCSEGVEVHIVDYDNASAEGIDGYAQVMELVRQIKEKENDKSSDDQNQRD